MNGMTKKMAALLSFHEIRDVQVIPSENRVIAGLSSIDAGCTLSRLAGIRGHAFLHRGKGVA